jgi:hypothetical protein
VLAFPITAIWTYVNTRSWKDVWSNTCHKLIIGAGVSVVTSIYWGPVLWDILRLGFTSEQATWFGMDYTDLTRHWATKPLDGALILAAAFFVGYLWDHWRDSKLAFLYMAGIVMIILDRALNLGAASNQSRKLLELTHVFAMAPLMIGVCKAWTRLGSYKGVRAGLVSVALIVAVVYANEHTEMYRSKLYETGINQQKPGVYLEPFQTVDARGKVFLTNKYIESCYIPYYLFMGVSSSSAHFASRYRDRFEFLSTLQSLADPELFAYALAYNKYDHVDYIYLPFNGNTSKYELSITFTSFGQKNETHLLQFPQSAIQDTTRFVLRHRFGLYEIKAPDRSQNLDSVLSVEFPAVYEHLQSVDESL